MIETSFLTAALKTISTAVSGSWPFLSLLTGAWLPVAAETEAPPRAGLYRLGGVVLLGTSLGLLAVILSQLKLGLR